MRRGEMEDGDLVFAETAEGRPTGFLISVLVGSVKVDDDGASAEPDEESRFGGAPAIAAAMPDGAGLEDDDDAVDDP